MGQTVNIQHAPAAASVAEKLATAGQNLSFATAVTAAQSSVHLKKKNKVATSHVRFGPAETVEANVSI